MAQIYKVDIETEVKCSADKIFDIYTSKAHLFPRICPGKVKNIQVLEGDWASVGSVKLWSYVQGGSECARERIEELDKHNKTVTFEILEGDILRTYKSWKGTLQVRAKDGGSVVKWTLEYEKRNEDTPPPNDYLYFVDSINKDIDAYLSKA